MLREIIILLLFTTLYTQYILSLNFPFLLDNKDANISTVHQDHRNGFYVGFKDKQFRHYTSSNFSAYSKNTFPYVIDFISSWWYTFANISLSNGSQWSMSSIQAIALTDNYQAFKVYNFTTMDELSSFSFVEKIIVYWGFPVDFFSTFIPHHLVISNETIKIIYNGITHNVLNFSQVYHQPGVICQAAIFHTWYQDDGLDYFQFEYVFYAALSTKKIINITVTLNFTMNYTISTFDVSISFKMFTIFNSPELISKFLLNNGLLLMQSNSTGTIYLYNTAKLIMGIVDAAIPKNEMFKFFSKSETSYILQSYGLIQIAFSQTNNKISFVKIASALPYNTYSLVFGNDFDVLYVPNTPYIYKAGYCMNQTQIDATNNCPQYSCLSSNCDSCSLSPAVCSICHLGFARDELYQCARVDSTNAQNSNQTNLSNMTQNQNQTQIILQNSTQQQNQSDSFSKDQNQQIPELLLFFYSQWIIDLMNFLIKFLKDIISIPAARKMVSPFFYYFGNFDDLFLYSYHQREYGVIMDNVFQQIQTIENSKWSLISLEKLCTIFGANSSAIQSIFRYQQKYMSDLQGLNCFGFFANCSNFLFVEIPIVFLVVIIMKKVFKTLMNFCVSQILRRFDFWIYFAIIIFEGNVQQFSFYLTTQLKSIFAFELINKYVKVLIIFIGYCLLTFSACGYILGLSFYKKLNRYFTDNNKNIYQGNWLLILQNGFRNIMLGVTHSLLRNGCYSILVSSLLMIEGIFFIIFLLGISNKVYIENKKIWIYILFTLFRMLLIFAFALDKTSINYVLFEYVQKILIFEMIALYLLSILFLLSQIFIQSACFLCKMCKTNTQSMIGGSTIINQSKLNRIAFSIKGLFNSFKANIKKERKDSKEKIKVFSIRIKARKHFLEN